MHSFRSVKFALAIAAPTAQKTKKARYYKRIDEDLELHRRDSPMHSPLETVCTPDNVEPQYAGIGAGLPVADARQHQVASMRAAYLRGLASRIEAGLPVAGMLTGIDWQNNANFNSFRAVLDQLADPALTPETIGNHLQKQALSECPQAASNLMALAALAGTISEFPGANS